MKTVILLLSFLLPLVTMASGPDDIIGIWVTENDEAKIQIYKTGNEYFGKIIWLKEPNDKNGRTKTDRNNPDPSKRNNPAIGILIFKNLQYRDGKWKGTIYGPKRGKETDCTLTLKDINVLEGSVKYGLMYGSKIMRRVK